MTSRLPAHWTMLAALAAATLAADVVLVVQRSGEPSATLRSTASPSPTPSLSPEASPTPAAETGLAALFAEPDLQRIADSIADTGPIDLAEAVKIDGEGAKSERFLKELGFRRAHLRTWGNVSREIYLSTLLYEFATPAGAKKFADGVYAARGVEAVPAEALQPAGVRTMKDPPDKDGDVLRYAIYYQGPRVALVTLLTDKDISADALRIWRQAAAAQAGRL